MSLQRLNQIALNQAGQEQLFVNSNKFQYTSMQQIRKQQNTLLVQQKTSMPANIKLNKYFTPYPNLILQQRNHLIKANLQHQENQSEESEESFSPNSNANITNSNSNYVKKQFLSKSEDNSLLEFSNEESEDDYDGTSEIKMQYNNDNKRIQTYTPLKLAMHFTRQRQYSDDSEINIFREPLQKQNHPNLPSQQHSLKVQSCNNNATFIQQEVQMSREKQEYQQFQSLQNQTNRDSLNLERQNQKQQSKKGMAMRSTKTGTKRLTMDEAQHNEQEWVVCLIENRQFEVGLAAFNVNTREMKLSQWEDKLTYMSTLSILMIFRPVALLQCQTQQDRLLDNKIRDFLFSSKCNFEYAKRQYFDDQNGFSLYKSFASQANSIANELHVQSSSYSRYLAYAAFNALVLFLEQNCSLFNLQISNYQINNGHAFVSSSMQYANRDMFTSIEWHNLRNAMIVEPQTVAWLELLLNNEHKKELHSFFSIFKCSTLAGQRFLRANLIQPPTLPLLLQQRHETLRELISNKPLFMSLKENLKNFKFWSRLTMPLVSANMQNIEEIENHQIVKQFSSYFLHLVLHLRNIKHLEQSLSLSNQLNKHNMQQYDNSIGDLHNLNSYIKSNPNLSCNANENGIIKQLYMHLQDPTFKLLLKALELQIDFNCPYMLQRQKEECEQYNTGNENQNHQNIKTSDNAEQQKLNSAAFSLAVYNDIKKKDALLFSFNREMLNGRPNSLFEVMRVTYLATLQEIFLIFARYDAIICDCCEGDTNKNKHRNKSVKTIQNRNIASKQLQQIKFGRVKLIQNKQKGYYLQIILNGSVNAMESIRKDPSPNNALNMYLEWIADLLQEELIEVKLQKKAVVFSTPQIVSLNSRLNECYAALLIESRKKMEKMMVVVREGVDIMFQITQDIAHVDILCSFAQLGMTYMRNNVEICLPQLVSENFSLFMVKEGTHPFLAAQSKFEQINVHNKNILQLSSANPFQVVLNDEEEQFEKTRFLKQQCLILILATIGCVVPAKSMHFTFASILLTKFACNDDIESHLSGLASELTQINSILLNLQGQVQTNQANQLNKNESSQQQITSNAFIAVDSLVHTSSPLENQLLSLAITERLLAQHDNQMKCFILFGVDRTFYSLLHRLYPYLEESKSPNKIQIQQQQQKISQIKDHLNAENAYLTAILEECALEQNFSRLLMQNKRLVEEKDNNYDNVDIHDEAFNDTMIAIQKMQKYIKEYTELKYNQQIPFEDRADQLQILSYQLAEIQIK